MPPCKQVENCKLKDYEGNYERFLENNEGEADVMAEKEAKKKELEKSQIKAKSKARTPVADLTFRPRQKRNFTQIAHSISTLQGALDTPSDVVEHAIKP